MSNQQILEKHQVFRRNGKQITSILNQLIDRAQESRDVLEVDQLAQTLIKKAGGKPAFMRVPGYSWATCICVNDGFVHCIPQGKLQDGDVVTIDTGMFLEGTTTDIATTFVIGTSTNQVNQFLAVGKKALQNAIKQAQPGNTVRDITRELQETIEAAGYNVTRNLTGHGLGKTMHESPSIPCFISNDPMLDVVLKPGMVLAIESMYMEGDHALVQDEDGWTLRTADGKLSAMFEEDVLLTQNGPELLTRGTLAEL